MIFKSREVGLYKGVANDLLYTASGGTSTNLLDYWTEAVALAQYYQFMATRYTSMACPSHIGNETFFSTERGRPRFNNCTHHINRAVNKPHGRWYQRVTSGRGYTPYVRMGFPSIPRPNREYAPHQIDDGFRARAFWSMRPKFRSQVELLNFIFELKDFRDIAKHLRHLDKTATLLDKAFRGTKKAPLKFPDPSVPAAKLHLLNSFAIQPLIRDIAAIQAALLHQVAHAQKSFEFMGGVKQKSHFTEVLFADNSQIVDNPKTDNYYMYSNGYSRVVKATATMEYRYSYKPRNAALAFMHYWGLTGSAEAFWNAIPGSFVVDYFLTIGRSLKIMRSDPNVSLHANQYCESVLDSRTTGLHTNLGYRNPIFVVDGVYYSMRRTQPILISGYEDILYTRKVREPYKGPALPKLKLPNSAQGRNLLALARCFV